MSSLESHTPQADAGAQLALDRLERGLERLASAPTDVGRVESLVSRGRSGERTTRDTAELSPESGLEGDRWARDRVAGEERYGADYADMQVTVMAAPVARLIANGQPLALFGDNLFVDLDLSAANVPPGSRLRIGRAKLEVTPFPHEGCAKFKQRFGAAALRLVSGRAQRERNLRGIYLRVLEPGRVRIGDEVSVLSRPGGSAT